MLINGVCWVTLCRDIVPLGRSKSKFNYNLDEKRVLNFENVVNDDDNIKQDISIDVYGRAEKADEEQEAAAEAEPPKVGSGAAWKVSCPLTGHAHGPFPPLTVGQLDGWLLQRPLATRLQEEEEELDALLAG